MKGKKGMRIFGRGIKESLAKAQENSAAVEAFLNEPVDFELYQPAPDEPCVFSEREDMVSYSWARWRHNKDVKKRQDFTGETQEVDMGSADWLLNGKRGRRLKTLIREQLQLANSPLPEKPPSMYVQGKGAISMAWVLDTVRRDGYTPEEAVGLARALARM